MYTTARPCTPCTPMYALYATVHHRTPLHALKGQKLLAQGNALGIKAIRKAPCKGKSFIFYLEF